MLSEARAAARGTFALVVGDKGASRYFDFSQRGLVSSFIALLAAIAFELLLSSGSPVRGAFAALISNAILYGAVLGATWLFLRQISRGEVFQPFIVTVNWANAVLSIALGVSVLLGLGIVGILILIAGLVLTINIGRVIMSLRPGQIVLLIIVQAVGLFAALLVLALIFPPTPEQLAALNGQLGS